MEREGEIERTRRIQGINVNADVDRIHRSHTISNFLDYTRHTNRVDLARFDNFKTAVPVVFVVGEARQGSADTGVDVAVVCEKTLVVGVIKIGAVVDGGLLGWRAPKDFRSPSITT